jgi:hypothetical protein
MTGILRKGQALYLMISLPRIRRDAADRDERRQDDEDAEARKFERQIGFGVPMKRYQRADAVVDEAHDLPREPERYADGGHYKDPGEEIVPEPRGDFHFFNRSAESAGRAFGVSLSLRGTARRSNRPRSPQIAVCPPAAPYSPRFARVTPH